MQLTRDFDRSPMVAIWELTRACDLRCLHCRTDAMPDRDPGELSTAEASDVIEQLRELDPAVVVLTGGDPLKRPDLFTIIEHAVARGLTVAITPSVTPLLNAEAIRHLADAGISRIALSLDGPDARTHDGIRGVPGSFDATLEAIAAVRATGLPLQINTSLMRRNARALHATGNLVAWIAPTLWSVFFVVPVGRGEADQQLDASVCEKAFLYLCDWTETTGLAVKTTAAPAYRRVFLEREAARRREGLPARPRPLPINDGKGFIFISHTGEVYPSGFLPLAVANVRWDRLTTIYRTNPLLRALREDSFIGGKCGICQFRAVCGGSRARAFATTGSAFAEDPACAYTPPSKRPAQAEATFPGPRSTAP